ncbi:hypothetical protein C0991_008928 [Blastosporella zonata]|nr:hypothetical protein C0991_008928 [Blastosporella zonata]
MSLLTSTYQLGLSYVDLYLIHHPRSVAPDFAASWKVLEKLKDDVLTKSMGLGNFNLEELQLISKTARIKPSNSTLSGPLVEYCEKHHTITTYPDGPVDATVQAAAERLGVTPAQVIFSWVKAKGVK